MALDSLERFALTQLLGMAGVLRTRWDLMDFDVLGRERTTSGFYTLIQQHEVLESLPSSLELILPIILGEEQHELYLPKQPSR